MKAPTPGDGPSGAAVLWGLAALALGFRLGLAAWTPVPAEDGVNYLWMAEGFAAGDFVGPIVQVFPPLGPLLMALPIALGVDPLWAGQGVMALAGAWSVFTVARATELAVPGGAGIAGLLMAFSPLAARYGAEVYSEPLFIAIVGLATAAGLRDQPWRCGMWAGVGFWVRPEALVIPLGFALARGRRQLLAYVPLGLAIGALCLWRGLAMGDFHPLPKLVFNLERGLDESRQWGRNLLALLPAAVEAYGPLLVLVAVAAVRRTLGPVRTLGWAYGVAMVPLVTFAVRRRFLVSWTGWVITGATAGLRGTPPRVRRPVLAGMVLYGLVVGWQGLTAGDRIGERELGHWLRQQLAPGEAVVTDMTRVLWFAGRQPLPPRHFTADEFAAQLRDPDVRFAVFSTGRDSWAELAPALGSWIPVRLPTVLARQVEDRGLAVLTRR